MNRHSLITILLFLTFSPSFCQSKQSVESIDTLMMPEVSFRKTIAYRLTDVTLLIDYHTYMQSLTEFWKKEKKIVKHVRMAKTKDEKFNRHTERTFRSLDSFRTVLRTQVRQRDTMRVNRDALNRRGINPNYNFGADIDKGRCTIIDEKNTKYRVIIRKKVTAGGGGMLDSRGVKHYYLIGNEWSFLSVLDWIS